MTAREAAIVLAVVAVLTVLGAVLAPLLPQ